MSAEGGRHDSVTGGYGVQNDDVLPDRIARTPGVIFGYVADSCRDANYWCFIDTFHVDISQSYLQSRFPRDWSLWNNRKISWEYLPGPPPGFSMSTLRFAWAENANALYYRALIVYNTPAGVSRMLVKLIDGKWAEAPKNGRCGRQQVLPSGVMLSTDARGRWQVRVESVYSSAQGAYGVYAVRMPSGSSSVEQAASEKLS